VTKLLLNGEDLEVTSKTVSDLLEEVGLAKKRIAVELNREIVPRSTYSTAILRDGDAVEIVHCVSGG